MSQYPASSQHVTTYVYRPTDALTPWLYSLLGTGIGVYVIALAVKVIVLAKYPELLQMTPGQTPPAHMVAPVMGLSCTSCLDWVLWIAWTVLLLVWVYRSVVNVRALGGRTRFSPGVCVVLLLPLVNVVMGGAAMSDLVRGAAGPHGQRNLTTVTIEAWVWWVCLALNVILSLAAGVVFNPQLVNRPDLLPMLSAAQGLFGVAWMVLTIALVRRVQVMLAASLGSLHQATYGRAAEPWEM